jgi:hypothetical protein
MAGNEGAPPPQNDPFGIPGASSGAFGAGGDLPGDQPGVPPGIQPDANTPPKKPRVKVFDCTRCGAPVTIRYPGAAISVICTGCNSVIDANDPNHQILTKFASARQTYRQVLDLGARGKIKGRMWEVIGFMVRSDVGSGYSWSEYLLFNPYYGFRWLVLDKGHWNFVTTIKRKPDTPLSSIAVLDDKKYRLYNAGRTQVDHVIGEFYWRVVVGSQVGSKDYINPPHMLSMEKDDNEVVWSMAEYIPRNDVLEAFKPAAGLPASVGVSPTQPANDEIRWNKLKMLFLIFTGIITVAQVYFMRTAVNSPVLDYTCAFSPNTKKPDTTTPVFTMSKDKANVEIIFRAPVSNSWFWAGGELVNDDTGVSYPFEASVEYYFGTDGGEYWSEGGNLAKVTFSCVPAGKYYINMDTESGSFPTTDLREFTVDVFRDVPNYDNYMWCFFLLSIIPVLSWVKVRQFEAERWANSDFSPYQTSTY